MVTVAAAVQLLSKLMVVLWVLGPTAPQWLVLAALVPPEVLGPLALKTWQVAQLYQLCPCTLQLSLCSLSPPPVCTLQLSAVLRVPPPRSHPTPVCTLRLSLVVVATSAAFTAESSLCDQLTML